MGKKWRPEEEAILAAQYGTAESVDALATQLGRPRNTVIRKAFGMGLSRPTQHEKFVARLKAAVTTTPSTTREIADRMGIEQTSVTELLNRGYDEKLCHIAKFRAMGGRGRDVPLWVAGPGEHAVGRTQKTREVPKEPTSAPIFRDPFITAFFGPCRMPESIAELPTHVYMQPMNVDRETA